MTVEHPNGSPSLEFMRVDVMARNGSFVSAPNPFARFAALWRALQPERSTVQVRAGYLLELACLAPAEIRLGWTLAGEHLPTAQTVLALPDPANVEHMRQVEALGIPEGQLAEARERVTRWREGLRRYGVGESDERYEVGSGTWAGAETGTVYWGWGWMENHSIRDYAKVLRVGFGGIRRGVEKLFKGADLSAPEFPERENFWRAALLVCDAGIALGRRYADLARRMAAESEKRGERDTLAQMADTCARVPEQGARTFRETVQSLWLAHILTCGEDGINANSLGRLDQILYPYYRADIESGTLTRQGAIGLMEELACKLYLDYDVQAITLGGLDRDGNDAVNDLSYIILEATRNVGFVRDLSVRFGPTTPQAFVDLSCALIARGGGIPFIFNDACYVPALVERGVSVEDARDYAPIGCVELTIPGKANPHAVSGWFNSTKCLELALFNGVDPLSGEQIGPETGDLVSFGTFDDLFRAYGRQVEFFANRMVYMCNRGELRQREHGPLPCWSVLTDDCIARGRDITDGGALYNYHSICLLGTANTADSLMAIKRLVFDDDVVDRMELLDALRADFEGHEPLRHLLLTLAPKYGNDSAEVDALAYRVAEQFIDLMDQMRSPLKGRYFVHLFSFYCNLVFGKTTGATPDGRRAHEPLAYSLSAHQGRDVEGVTAMLNSLAKLPHGKAAGGSAAIIEIEPVFVDDAEGPARLAQVVQAALAMGVGQMQWNVTTAERLEQAQRDPEQYGNIAVRVAGYSQMFKLINEELQNHIIARTKHRR